MSTTAPLARPTFAPRSRAPSTLRPTLCSRTPSIRRILHTSRRARTTHRNNNTIFGVLIAQVRQQLELVDVRTRARPMRYTHAQPPTPLAERFRPHMYNRCALSPTPIQSLRSQTYPLDCMTGWRVAEWWCCMRKAATPNGRIQDSHVHPVAFRAARCLSKGGDAGI